MLLSMDGKGKRNSYLLLGFKKSLQLLILVAWSVHCGEGREARSNGATTSAAPILPITRSWIHRLTTSGTTGNIPLDFKSVRVSPYAEQKVGQDGVSFCRQHLTLSDAMNGVQKEKTVYRKERNRGRGCY